MAGRRPNSIRDRARLSWLIPLVLHVGGCQQQPLDQDPARVVEAFIDRMRAVHGVPERGRLAFELLWSKARENLEERAARASAASGRPVTASEMLVPSRFSLAFEPVDYRAEIKGHWSRVAVIGRNPQEQLVEIDCYREEEGWRVVLDLPPLPPIQTRD